MFSALLAKVTAFARTHGAEVVVTYVGAVITLVTTHTADLANGGLLSLFVAAALVTAKSLSAPAFVTDFLAKVQAKFTKPSGK